MEKISITSHQTLCNRIESLDWLRGLMAISILVFHFLLWSGHKENVTYLIYRLGVYGVSIFFVLSGLSMAIVYNKYINSLKKSIYFFIRRLFRLLPLMILATFATVFFRILSGYTVSLKLLLLNITMLFSFISPTSYIPTGAWSLGNEVVYYTLTPVIFFLYNKKLFFGNLLFFGSLFLGFYFSTFALNSTQPPSEWWPKYVNPFNNLFLYVAGIALYYNFNNIVLSTWTTLTLMLLGLLLLSCWPVKSDLGEIGIITGLRRIVFCIASLLITFSFWKMRIPLPWFIRYPLDKFGMATYSVYLLHPLLLNYLWKIDVFALQITGINILDMFVLLSGTIFVIVTISLFVYKYLETPFIKMGKKITSTPVKN